MGSTDEQAICSMPATELAARIRRRELSPVEVAEAHLRRIERLNPTLNAYCTPTPDVALAQARAVERRLLAGEEVGPLAGVPVSIKDLTITRGVRTTRGSLLYADFVPDEDAPPVERLRAAGAVMLGKTNTPEFGYKGVTDNRVFGATRNPWHLDRTPGGSSGGAGAAVAAGLGPLALGSDGGGSIRIPSSFCGIYGIKPAFGRVPVYPASAAEYLSHVGPMTRTVADAALMLDVIAGPDERDRNSLPATGERFLVAVERADELPRRALRVAWSPTLGYARVDPEVAELTARAARRFEELGCRVEEANPGFKSPHETFQVLFWGMVGASLVDHLPHRREHFDPGMVDVIEGALRLDGVTVARAYHARSALWDTVRRFFDRYDLLLTPTVAVPAFPLGQTGPTEIAGERVARVDWTPFTYPFNLTGQPAATVPCGFTREGLPVGLQIVGRRYDEATVLQASAAFERLQPWAQVRPPLD